MEKEERRQLIRKIGRYRAIFGKELTDVKTTGLDVMPLASLRDLATDVELHVDPVARLCLGIMQLAVAVDAHNRQKEWVILFQVGASDNADGLQR